MFKRLFLVFLVFFFAFPRSALSTIGNELPYSFIPNGVWYPPNPDWILANSSDINTIEKILLTVTKPVNYCAVCEYGFWFKVRAILIEDNPQRKPYWYDGLFKVSARFQDGKCLFYHRLDPNLVASPVSSGLASLLQQSIDSLKDNGDRTVLYSELRAGSSLSSYEWHSRGCDKLFELPNNNCPNFHIRSLPVVRVRVRC